MLAQRDQHLRCYWFNLENSNLLFSICIIIAHLKLASFVLFSSVFFPSLLEEWVLFLLLPFPFPEADEDGWWEVDLPFNWVSEILPEEDDWALVLFLDSSLATTLLPEVLSEVPSCMLALLRLFLFSGEEASLWDESKGEWPDSVASFLDGSVPASDFPAESFLFLLGLSE